MFGESRSTKPEEDKRPAGVSPRVSPSSRQRPMRISSSPFSSTMARTPEQQRKALGKGSESNNPRKTLGKDSQRERAMNERPIAEYLKQRRWIAEGNADYGVFVVTASGID
jgi:hypothetical protein